MPDLSARNEHNRLVLEVRYVTRIPISAVECGVLISELGKGFERYACNQSLTNLRLTVVGGRIGSDRTRVAVVRTAFIAATAILYQKEIEGFASFLAVLFEIARASRGEKTNTPDDRLINAIIAPVATQQATQVIVTLLGEEPLVTIGQEAANILRLKHSDFRIAASCGIQKASSYSPEHFSNTFFLRAVEGSFGRVLKVGGQWFVRLEGGEGVMFPVTSSRNVSLNDDRVYELYGTWDGRRLNIDRADLLGAPSKPD